MTGAISLTPQTIGRRRAAAGRRGAAVHRRRRRCSPNPIAWKLILLVFIQVMFVTMVYGPIAAYLVEAFPAKIRYTALSLPYHIGNGVFGGLLPLIGSDVVAATGNIYAGLYYPIAVAGAHVRRRIAAAEGDAQRADLEGSAGGSGSSGGPEMPLSSWRTIGRLRRYRISKTKQRSQRRKRSSELWPPYPRAMLAPGRRPGVEADGRSPETQAAVIATCLRFPGISPFASPALRAGQHRPERRFKFLSLRSLR